MSGKEVDVERHESTDAVAASALRVLCEVDIEKMPLSAGDVVVVRSKRKLTPEMARRICDQIKHLIARDDVRCLVTDDEIDISALTRAEIEAMAS